MNISPTPTAHAHAERHPVTGDSNSTVGGGVKIEGGRVGGEIEGEVAMVDKACGAVTWVGA